MLSNTRTLPPKKQRKFGKHLTDQRISNCYYTAINETKTFGTLVNCYREHLCSPPGFDGVSAAHIFSFLCCVFLSSSCVAYAQCCQCCLRLTASKVSNGAIVSGLSILDWTSVFPYVYLM